MREGHLGVLPVLPSPPVDLSQYRDHKEGTIGIIGCIQGGGPEEDWKILFWPVLALFICIFPSGPSPRRYTLSWVCTSSIGAYQLLAFAGDPLFPSFERVGAAGTPKPLESVTATNRASMDPSRLY